MEQTENKKRIPIVPILTITLIVASVVVLFLTASSDHLEVFFPLLTILSSAAFIVSMTCNKKGEDRKFRIPTIISSSILLGISTLILMLFGLRYFINYDREQTDKLARKSVTIQYVKKNTPKEMMNLRAPYNEQLSTFEFYDDDGKIAEKFCNMEFTLQSSDPDAYVSHASEPFYQNKDFVVYFLSDYSGIDVRTLIEQRMVLFGMKKLNYRSIYTCDTTEALELKAMITAKVEEQGQAYLAKEQEIKAGLTIESVANGYDKATDTLVNEYRQVIGNNVEFLDIEDKQAVFINALKEIDFSQVSVVEDFSSSIYDYRCSIKGPEGSKYFVFFLKKSNILEVRKVYTDQFNHKRDASLVYKISDEDTARLADVVSFLVYGI